VHPTEIEDLLLQLDNVKDVTVRGQPNPITGEVVAAKITALVPEDPDALKRRVRQFCRARLEPYKVPVVVDVVVEDHYGARFKKSRIHTSVRRGAGTEAGS
jgi:acyl-coenzyme A synthetase/AMP-(fatty) acid ligase